MIFEAVVQAAAVPSSCCTKQLMYQVVFLVTHYKHWKSFNTMPIKNQPRKYFFLIALASMIISLCEFSSIIPVRKLSAMSITNHASELVPIYRSEIFSPPRPTAWSRVRRCSLSTVHVNFSWYQPEYHCSIRFVLYVNWFVQIEFEYRKRHKYWYT